MRSSSCLFIVLVVENRCFYYCYCGSTDLSGVSDAGGLV